MNEIIAWLGRFRWSPRMTFNSPEASDALRRRIQDELGWPCPGTSRKGDSHERKRAARTAGDTDAMGVGFRHHDEKEATLR